MEARALLSPDHRFSLDYKLAGDNRFQNPKSSYERILMAPPCRLISKQKDMEERCHQVNPHRSLGISLPLASSLIRESMDVGLFLNYSLPTSTREEETAGS